MLGHELGRRARHLLWATWVCSGLWLLPAGWSRRAGPGSSSVASEEVSGAVYELADGLFVERGRLLRVVAAGRLTPTFFCRRASADEPVQAFVEVNAGVVGPMDADQ